MSHTDDTGGIVGFEAASRDAATVTPDGVPIVRAIDGVRTKRLAVHVDHRGRVFEIVNHDTDYWDEPIVHTYVFTVRPQQIKGWGLHETKRDRYCIVAGEMLVVLWDGREGSPTFGLSQRVLLTREGVQMLTIPVGVWHIDLNVGTDECVVVNHPTRPYDYARPDRLMLPWDTDLIPVDLRPLMPPQFRG